MAASVRSATLSQVYPTAVARPSSPTHRLRHELRFPSPEGADAAAVALSAQGLSVESGAEGEEWLLTAEETVALTIEEAARRRAALEALAQGYGGLYDGFSAEVMP